MNRLQQSEQRYANLRMLWLAEREKTKMLLEALEGLLEGYEMNYAGDEPRYTFSPEEWERRIEAGFAAKAKAKGES